MIPFKKPVMGRIASCLTLNLLARRIRISKSKYNTVATKITDRKSENITRALYDNYKSNFTAVIFVGSIAS